MNVRTKFNGSLASRQRDIFLWTKMDCPTNSHPNSVLFLFTNGPKTVEKSHPSFIVDFLDGCGLVTESSFNSQQPNHYLLITVLVATNVRTEVNNDCISKTAKLVVNYQSAETAPLKRWNHKKISGCPWRVEDKSKHFRPHWPSALTTTLRGHQCFNWANLQATSRPHGRW